MAGGAPAESSTDRELCIAGLPSTTDRTNALLQAIARHYDAPPPVPPPERLMLERRPGHRPEHPSPRSPLAECFPHIQCEKSHLGSTRPAPHFSLNSEGQRIVDNNAERHWFLPFNFWPADPRLRCRPQLSRSAVSSKRCHLVLL